MKKLLGVLTPYEIAMKTWTFVLEHDLTYRASAIAFSAVSAGVPFLTLLLTVFALSLPDFTGHGIQGGAVSVEQIRAIVREWFPEEIYQVIADQIALIQSRQSFELFSISSISLLATVWMASSLNLTIIWSLNCIYGVTETRAWWRLRLRSICMLLLQVLVGAVGIVCFLDGPMMLHHIGINALSETAATTIKWSVVFTALMGAFGLLFHMGPNAAKEKWVTPGSIFGAICFIVCSLGFRWFVVHFGQYGKLYGSLGGVMALFLWLWLSSLVLLIAAEMNRIIMYTAENRKLRKTCPPDCEHIEETPGLARPSPQSPQSSPPPLPSPETLQSSPPALPPAKDEDKK